MLTKTETSGAGAGPASFLQELRSPAPRIAAPRPAPEKIGCGQGRSQDFSKGGAEVMEAKALKRKSCL